MRWFFLLFVLGLAAVGNVVIFERLSSIRLVSGLTFNLFVASLIIVWWFSYFSAGLPRARGLVIGHAILSLAVGIGLACLGVSVALPGECDGLLVGRRPDGLLNQFVSYIQSLGHCRELGIFVVLVGLIVAYPSARLFINLRSNGRP